MASFSRSMYESMENASKKTVAGQLPFADYMTLFSLHHDTFLNEIREFIDITTQNLVESGNLTSKAITSYSEKYPWAWKKEKITEDQDRIELLEKEVLSLSTELRETRKILKGALEELNLEYEDQAKAIKSSSHDAKKELDKLEMKLGLKNNKEENNGIMSPLIQSSLEHDSKDEGIKHSSRQHNNSVLLPGERAARRASGVYGTYQPQSKDLHDARSFLDASSDEERPSDDLRFLETGSFSFKHA